MDASTATSIRREAKCLRNRRALIHIYTFARNASLFSISRLSFTASPSPAFLSHAFFLSRWWPHVLFSPSPSLSSSIPDCNVVQGQDSPCVPGSHSLARCSRCERLHMAVNSPCMCTCERVNERRERVSLSSFFSCCRCLNVQMMMQRIASVVHTNLHVHTLLLASNRLSQSVNTCLLVFLHAWLSYLESAGSAGSRAEHQEHHPLSPKILPRNSAFREKSEKRVSEKRKVIGFCTRVLSSRASLVVLSLSRLISDLRLESLFCKERRGERDFCIHLHP